MKVIIAGCRDIHSDKTVRLAMKEAALAGIIPSEVVSGKAAGVDAAGERWAVENGLSITPFPADWGRHGKSAGPIRNRLMAAYADALVAIWDGKSRGTANMIEEMRKLKKPVLVAGPDGRLFS